MSLRGLTVLVTGAGGGVGRGIALASAAAGAHVFVGSRGHTGEAVTEEIAARGHLASWVRCDVTDRESVINAVSSAVSITGRLDAVVHNATSGASSQPHELAAVDESLWEEHVSVSLRGAYYCAQAAFEALSAQSGTLVVMTSAAGMKGSATLPLYSMMKGALRGFAKSLAREWGPSGVTVNVVSPIAFSPAMTAAIAADPLMGERLSRQIPLGRVGDPENDVGVGVAMLLGSQARYVTGQTLGIDGGHFTSL